jgi:CubicO group peptidase (beta-lactamase class C family)
VAVALDDSLVWSAGFGLADVENEVPARGNTVYRIASISKTFGATAVLQLVDRGRVGLDDPITRYVPSLAHPVTLRQILTHTSGIRHYGRDRSNTMVRHATLAEAIQVFRDDPLEFEPGTGVRYSTYAFNLLAGVPETALGVPLETYLREEVFEPAGLTQTHLEYAERIVPHRARGYVREAGELFNVEYADLSAKWLGGGMISSAEDLVRYGVALARGSLVSPESLRLMNTPATLNDGTAVEYSLGWETSVAEDGRRHADKYGSGAGVSTYLLRVPEEGFTLALLVNLGGRGNIRPFALRIAEAIAR